MTESAPAGLRIWVRPSGDDAPRPREHARTSPLLEAPAAASAAPARVVHASRRSASELEGRVREALRCPYCREDVASQREVEPGPTALGVFFGPSVDDSDRTERLDTYGLLILAALAAPLTLLLGALGSGEAAILAFATAAACLLHVIATRPLLKVARLVVRAARRLDGGEEHASVACARRGCGALYHAECWEECRASYGACAVFACGSTEAEGVTRATLLVRATRMVVAALLFTPRVVEALRQTDEAGVASIREAIRARADEAHRVMWAPGAGETRTGLSLLQFGTVIAGYAVSIPLCFYMADALDRVGLALLALVSIPVALVLGLYGASWSAAAVIYFAKAVLAGELAALSRLGQAGSYLSRLRASGGKKKG